VAARYWPVKRIVVESLWSWVKRTPKRRPTATTTAVNSVARSASNNRSSARPIRSSLSRATSPDVSPYNTGANERTVSGCR
jgi:hypothetical protein